MTDKIFFVRSYAHAEQNGIAPCDSIIGTVFDASKNTILAYAKGHTFSSRDVARDIGDAAIRTFEFWCDDPGTFDPNPEPNADPDAPWEINNDEPDLTVFANRAFTAKIVFFEKFGNVKARMFERITTLAPLGDARMNPVSGP